jgi:hypothetical protein
MNHELHSTIARGRVDEKIARARWYGLAHSEIRRCRQAGLDQSQRFAVRKALAAVWLSLLLVLSLASAAAAVPVDSGAGASGTHPTKSSQSQGLDASSSIPVVGFSLAVVAGVAILVLATKRHSRLA